MKLGTVAGIGKLFAVNARMRVSGDVFGTDEERSFAVARETVHDPMAQKAGSRSDLKEWCFQVSNEGLILNPLL